MTKEKNVIPYTEPSIASELELARMKLPGINRKVGKGVKLTEEEKIIWDAFGGEYRSKHRFLKSKI